MVGTDQRVLELGASSGHVTRALVARQCHVTAVENDAEAAAELRSIAAKVIVGDLNDPATLAGLAAEFDVVLAGDVLEHLIDPQAVLNRVVKLVVPSGRIVISLPNVAHADVRLSLLQGRFTYTDWGLLDRTHMRFFTRQTLGELVRQAGLQIVEMERVRMPAFETEQAVDRQSVSTPLLDEVLKDPEAETYQFVFTAVPNDGSLRMAQLSARCEELQLENERQRVASMRQLLELERRLEAAQEERQRAVSDLARLQATKLFRYTQGLRRLYGGMRRRND